MFFSNSVIPLSSFFASNKFQYKKAVNGCSRFKVESLRNQYETIISKKVIYMLSVSFFIKDFYKTTNVN